MTDDSEERELHVEGDPWIGPDDLVWVEATKRPVTVEAAHMPMPFEVETMEGTMQGDAGDVLIRGVEGELYPCDLEIFEQTYDIEGHVAESTDNGDCCFWVKAALALVLGWKAAGIVIEAVEAYR